MPRETMATSLENKRNMSKPEVVTDLARCLDIMQGILVSGEPIVIDMEGVRLNAIGPLTLMQLMTSQGEVYLLDIQENPDLILKGDIREVLESSDVRKIMHGCFSDSGALYHQFDKTKLNNVFDTSVADLVIKQHVDKERFPKHLRLSDLINKYGGEVDSAKSLQAVWLHDDSYWTKRPLTEDMIRYATADVRMLYPNVYHKLLGYIEENNLWEHFREQVDENINEQIDFESVKKAQKARKLKIVAEVLKELESEKKSRTKLDDFTSDQQTALWESLKEDVLVSMAVESMANDLFRATLEKMISDMKSDFKHFVFKTFTNDDQERIEILSEKRKGEDQLELSQKASALLRDVSKRSINRIQNKISQDCWLSHREKIQLMQSDNAMLTPRQIGIINEEKKEVLEQNEKNIKKSLKGKAENYIYLRRNEIYLLRTIPYKNLGDSVIKQAKTLLLQDK